MKTKTKEPLQGTLFEENYLVRTLGTIVASPDVALTELVANAWDAGASSVKITIPEQSGKELIVEDDGTGMTSDEFRHRWMTLGYNRVRNQGTNAEFPSERPLIRRPAYGRNGVGRHGLLCFADRYQVSTQKSGRMSIFTVSTSSGKDPFVILDEKGRASTSHGTRLVATVQRHVPDADRIRDVLAARFLHDPEFTVFVNGRSVPLSEHSGLIDQTDLEIASGLSAQAFFVDSTKSARTTRQQGIAFWVGGRLVGTPSWILGLKAIIDGRTTLAKRYTVVVKSDSLFDHVQPDWSGFKPQPLVDSMYEKVGEYVTRMFKQLSAERVEETKETVLREYQKEIKDLQPLARLEVSEFIEQISEKSYAMPQESLSIAVQALIHLEKSKSGNALLEKLSKLSDKDIQGLDRLLSEWSVRDALTVLDEIERRIAVVEAIGKLCADKRIDELTTLHPLVTQARWLFGPEFESAEYSSNLTLRKAVEKVLHKRIVTGTFQNHRRRPDLLLLGDATVSAVSVDEFDSASGLNHMRDILLIELKRGGSQLDRPEMNQATEYVEELLGCGLLDGNPVIRAFVVGDECKPGLQIVRKVGDPERAQIRACTYGQLVRTAEQRLFNLRQRLTNRYDQLSGDTLLSKVLADPDQGSLFVDLSDADIKPSTMESSEARRKGPL